MYKYIPTHACIRIHAYIHANTQVTTLAVAMSAAKIAATKGAPTQRGDDILALLSSGVTESNHYTEQICLCYRSLFGLIGLFLDTYVSFAANITVTTSVAIQQGDDLLALFSSDSAKRNHYTEQICLCYRSLFGHIVFMCSAHLCYNCCFHTAK